VVETKKVGGGEDERTNPCKNYTSSSQELYFIKKGKEMARTR
jgi:hypothetical protein